ncbi:hypothetical protein [Runella sp.]|uniref:hypothetical protein n=1 Tax=Runella sp. TaxID=1960881 RepID=UPI003D0DD139
MPRIAKYQNSPKVLKNSTPVTVADVEFAVNHGKHKIFSEAQQGACRRILNDGLRALPFSYSYPSLTKAYQLELLRLESLLRHFDLY